MSNRAMLRVLGELGPRQRIQAWVDAMRRAGGLAFKQADEAVQFEIFEIEQTTDEYFRKRFQADRSRVLAANALLSWALGADRLRSETLLARITSLLSLLLVVKLPAGRDVLEQAVRERDGDGQARPLAGKTRSKSRKRISPTELSHEVALLYGLMFGYQDDELAAYWDEVLTSEALSEPAVRVADLDKLLSTDGDPIARALGHYGHHLWDCIRRPGVLHIHLLTNVVDDLGPNDLTLPPVDAQLARNDRLAQALTRTRFEPYVYRLRAEETAPLLEMAMEPREHLRTQAVINSYEKWLYPSRRDPYLRPDVEPEWEPWDDYYNEPQPWEGS